MNRRRKDAAWFLGAMLLLPVVEYLFSSDGARILMLIVVPLGAREHWLFIEGSGFSWLSLLVGFGVAAALFAFVVSRADAPGRLWYVALASAVLRLASVAADVTPWWLVASGDFRDASFQQALQSRVSYGPLLFLASVFGYLAAACIGCWIGTRAGHRTPTAATSREQETHTGVTSNKRIQQNAAS